MTPYPSRIVCLTEETTETLYILGEGERVVGVSAYTVRPPEARSKPRVSAFIRAHYDRIEALNPDLILGFSDLQAEIASDLIKRGHPVMVFNQRSVAEILQMIRVVGALVGCTARADALADRLEMDLDFYRTAAAALPRRPRVYFEEWDDPMISGIRWVEELIEIAGGEDCFSDQAQQSLARHRIIADPMEVVRRAPDIILGSWCGKKFRPEIVAARSGWERVPAVANGALHEIKSSIILQPGPAALTDGVAAMHAIFSAWQAKQ